MTIMETRGPTRPEVTGREIGQRIKGFRLIRGFDLDEMAAETGISIESLKLYERGRRVPGGYRMLLIMEALQLVPADLLKTEV
jgi:transcriptional regulator with XRE-family HTH domain